MTPIQLVRSHFFNKKSISIFTDSSYTNINDSNTACPGYCIYWDDILIEQGFDIKQNTTSQRGELYAILMAVIASYKYRRYNIRIFSDSQTSIFAIRYRIFNWINKTNNGEIMLGDEGIIQNQDIIMEIVYTILNNNIPIEFYHVKGHVKTYDRESIEHAKEVFMNSNRTDVPYIITDDLINLIIRGNIQVDKYTGFMLDKHINDPAFDRSNMISALTPPCYGEFDVVKYKSLVENIIFKKKGY